MNCVGVRPADPYLGSRSTEAPLLVEGASGRLYGAGTSGGICPTHGGRTKYLVLSLGWLVLIQAAEVCKNIVLAGIGGLTLWDEAVVADVYAGNFLVPHVAEGIGSSKLVAEVMAESLREMNPMVPINFVKGRVATVTEATLESFEAVVLACSSFTEQIRIDQLCRNKGIAFYAMETRASFSYFFADLGHHMYAVDVKNGDEESTLTEQRTATFPSLATVLEQASAKLPKRTHHGVYLLQVSCRAILDSQCERFTSTVSDFSNLECRRWHL